MNGSISWGRISIGRGSEEEIGTKLVNDRKKREADVIIEPDMEGRYWLDFQQPERVIEAGAVAARKQLPALRGLSGRFRLGRS